MEKYLREWRQEALNRHQYDTAIFVADKLLALTGTYNAICPDNSLVLMIQHRRRTRHILAGPGPLLYWKLQPHAIAACPWQPRRPQPTMPPPLRTLLNQTGQDGRGFTDPW